MIIAVVPEDLEPAAYNQIPEDASYVLIVNKLRASLNDRDTIAPLGSVLHACYDLI